MRGFFTRLSETFGQKIHKVCGRGGYSPMVTQLKTDSGQENLKKYSI
jgi:hypothetical protein